MLNVDNRVIMISGANRGIGRAIANRLLAEGFRLSLGARNIQKLKRIFNKQTERVKCFKFEATDLCSMENWVDSTINIYGQLDGLINNAGAINNFSIEVGEEFELDYLWKVNCKAPLFLTRFCLPHLKKSGIGRIINISSLSGKRVRNEKVAYNMSKHALMALSHGTRQATWKDGIRVTAICPSFVDTEMVSGTSKISKELMIKAEDLAEVVSLSLKLPNNAAIPEIVTNCRLEDQF